MELPDSIQVFSDKYLETISDAFKSLYNEEQLSDVTIYCKEGSLKAHKLILAASSPYFCKIFMENRNDYPILILQGTSLNQMKNLIDLLYHGRTNVKNDDIEALNSLIREFEIKGINFGPKTTASNVRLEICSNDALSDGGHNRDTRFKGRKRVAVDYEREENLQVQEENNEMHVPKRSLKEIVQVDETHYIKGERTSPTTEDILYSSSDVNSISDMSSCMENSENKLTAWARKQRKFKCDLCPSSFKRSSHLSRHQLVHTGERPYSCSRCEKAFSRHDKLKHHIRKAHEFIPDSMYERIDDAIDSDTESGVRNYTSPRQIDSENSSTVPTPKSLQRNTSSPLFTISHITSILEDSFVNPPKKGRGRPRKHPLPVPPTLKRGRGRSKYPAYPPRLGVQNYNITNLPYGDLNYLTSQNSAGDEDESPAIMEPLVEINIDQFDHSKEADGEKKNQGSSTCREPTNVQICEDAVKIEQNDDADDLHHVDISEIENKIGLIGECTISVAN